MAGHQLLLITCLMTVVGWHAAAAQGPPGLTNVNNPIHSGPLPPPSKTCGRDCCPSNQVCVCNGCFPAGGPFPVCAFPDPGVVRSCCDDPGTQCNRCNGWCCLGDDVCSCKGTCIDKDAEAPECGPDEYGVFGDPLQNCCDQDYDETSLRCAKLSFSDPFTT